MFDLGSAVGYLLLDTKDFQSGLDKANAGLKTFYDKNAKAGDKLKGLSSAAGQIGGDMTKYVTLPLIGAGTAFVSFASEMESAFDSYKAQVGETTADLEEYKDVMDEIYKNNYGENYEDIANSMAEITKQLGDMEPEKMQELTESALALRDTIGYDVPESVRTVDTLMKNFGLTAEEAFDYIVEGNQRGLDYSDEFLDSINEYSVQFEKLGLDADDMFNIFETGAESGAWNLDKIGDAVKEFSIRAIDGSDTTRHAFETLGYDFEDTMAIFAEGGESAREVFFEMIAQLSDMDDEVEKSATGVELFGTMWEDLGPEVFKQLSDMQSGAVDMKGAMDELKEVKYDNLNSALAGLGRSLKSAGAELGQYLIPIVEDAIDIVDGLVEKFEEMPESSKQMIVTFGLIAAAIGPVLLIIGKVAGLASSFVGLVQTAGTVSAALKGVGVSIGALAGPVLAVIAVVGLLVAAWATDFGGIREKTQEIFDSISEIIQVAMDLIKSVWENDLFGIRSVAETIWQTIEEVFSDAFAIISDVFAIFSDLITFKWGNLWNDVLQLLQDIWTLIVDLISGFSMAIVQFITGWYIDLVGAFEFVWNKAWEAIRNIWQYILDWLEQVKNDPVNAILSIGQGMFDAGAKIFNMLWDGLKSIWDGIVSWVEDCVSWIIDKVTFWENESSKVDNGSGGAGRSSGSHANGLDYVPYDGYIAETHEGEAILTKNEAEEYRRNKNEGGDTYNFYSPKPISELEAARQLKRVKREIAEGIL